MMHDYLATRGIRSACEITLILPLETPVPPSPETSRALLAAFAERNITFVADREVRSIDTQRRVATIDDGREFPTLSQSHGEYRHLNGTPDHGEHLGSRLAGDDAGPRWKLSWTTNNNARHPGDLHCTSKHRRPTN